MIGGCVTCARRYLSLLLRRRIQYAAIRGSFESLDNGEEAFARLSILPAQPLEEGHCYLVARFSPPERIIGLIKWLTPITLPFFTGFPGLIEKVFLIDRRSGTLIGQYRWTDMDTVSVYVHSKAAWAMGLFRPASWQIIRASDGVTIGEGVL